jgi:hypothetical protein
VMGAKAAPHGFEKHPYGWPSTRLVRRLFLI